MQKHKCTRSPTAAPFVVAFHWKQTKCQSTGAWLSKLWDIHNLEGYASFKKNEFYTFHSLALLKTLQGFHLYSCKSQTPSPGLKCLHQLAMPAILTPGFSLPVLCSDSIRWPSPSASPWPLPAHGHHMSFALAVLSAVNHLSRTSLFQP